MLTDEQSDLLIEYYKNVHFSESQKKEIIQLYWQATNEERREISKVYCKLFATDSVFIQRLIQYKDAMGSGEAGATTGEETEDASHAPSAGNRVTHAQRLLRSSIADQFPILRREENKNRTFQLQFELVVSESQRREVIDLYSSQFISPEPAELLDLVPLSNTFSTRTRRQVQGHYSFLIRLLNPPADPDDANCRQQTKVVCAVTINAHTHSSASHKFIEMPLFATAAGYKKNGFAKLLNTALCEWVSRVVGVDFIMISADEEAIRFWRHLGYREMTRGEQKKIEFHYEHECSKFLGTTPMIMYCNRTAYKESRETDGVENETNYKFLAQHSVAQCVKEMRRFMLLTNELPSP